MAVDASVVSVKLQIRYIAVDLEGKETHISKTYSKVRAEATEQDIYDVAGILAGLQTKALYSIDKIQDSELVGA